MSVMRRCTRAACGRSAVATLTYVYADQTAVLGPLATFAEPHTYDLCHVHAERLTTPQGWELLRLATSFPAADESDDLLAVADALRDPVVEEPVLPGFEEPYRTEGDGTHGVPRVTRLRVLRDRQG